MAAVSGAPGPGARASDVVLRHVEEAILAGELRVGDHLPAERELAAELDVSRPAVREGLHALSAHGVVAAHVGAGRAGGTRVTAQTGSALARLLRLHVALGGFSVDDVVEARVILERSSATLAAGQSRAADLSSMRAALDAMASGDLASGPFNELDTEFHVCIARASHNALVTDLTVAVRESLRRPIRAAEERLGDWHTFRTDLQRQHEGIYAAIAAGEGERAADLVEAHIRFAYTALRITSS